ncbi:LacI family DNA-binding transcriptional regulator [Arthrobacter castelli]|uniref:LacI family DNA-binding transcriptional regulator n=1 Tax=Arthrobacter castelli TaxID=271431 RepID=UPI00040E0E94|nr:LacI family DNA-binding transcriptional regulator [Arthrobacter castelli]
MSSTAGGRPTIYDVAQAAGVSKSLVSLVLQGSPRVSESRREAVQHAIDKLGYQPSRAASTLAGAATRTIGVVIDDYRNLWFVDLLRGLQGVLEQRGFRIAVVDSELNSQVDASPLDGFISLRVDGIVIAAEPTENMRPVEGIPVVMAGNRASRVAGSDAVADDDFAGGRMATDHLLGLGHRHIGHMTADGESARLRARAYAECMDSAGLDAPMVHAGGGASEENGYRTARELLDSFPELTAVFASNDTMAMGALAAAREAGRRVPEDLSIIGYDNSPLAGSHLLDLTTVDDHSERVGDEAARFLLSRMDSPERKPREKYVTPHLVARSSTAPPRSA